MHIRFCLPLSCFVYELEKSCDLYVFGSLQYNSLTLCKRSPEDKEDQTFILKKHIGDPKTKEYVQGNDQELSLDSLIC